MNLKTIKSICFFILVFTFFTEAQPARNAVIGRYIVTSKLLDGANVVLQTCNTLGKIDLYPNNSWCNECISEVDSTDCSGHTGWGISSCGLKKVLPDSTILDTSSCGAYCANGKLFSNDSLYLRVKWCTLSYHHEVTGFKLYSSVNVAALNLPENSLLLSPNPANELVYLQSTQQTFTKEMPVLYDVKGGKTNVSFDYVNSHTYKLNVSNLASGVYFVFVQTNSGYLKKKLVVSK